MPKGRITKLNVNIANCQTHITYANNTTRWLLTNPSGFCFRNLGSSIHSDSKDYSSQARAFLYRHFGREGSIKKTPSIWELIQKRELANAIKYESIRLAALMPREPQVEQSQQDQESAKEELPKEEEQQQKEELQPISELEQVQKRQIGICYVELLPAPMPQRAAICKRNAETLKVRNCAWHLQNCSWRNFYRSEFHMPKCHCLKIKETMEYINELVDTSMPQEDDLTDFIPQANGNLMNLNGLLKQLNDLLDQQNKEQLSVQNI